MKILSFALTAMLVLAGTAISQAASLNDRLSEAITILSNRQNSGHPIPQGLLDGARAVAIVKVTKGGLVFGGTGGQGVILARNGTGWSAPSAFNLSGGSFGAQIGFETKRLIIVLNSERAFRVFAGEGKTKWDATATGSAGNDKLRESASDWKKLPIVVFEDNEGVFGGATFGGTSIDVAHDDNERAYGEGVTVHDILGGKVNAPRLAHRLDALLKGQK